MIRLTVMLCLFAVFPNKAALASTQTGESSPTEIQSTGTAKQPLTPASQHEASQKKQALLFSSLLAILAVVIFFLVRHIFSLKTSQTQTHERLSLLESDQQKLLEKNQELQDCIQHRDQLYALVAHDLKSPIAALNGLMQILSTEDLKEKDNLEMIQRLAPTVQSTYTIIERIVDWAQSRDKNLHLSQKSILLKEVFDEAITQIEPAIRSKNIKLRSEISAVQTVWFDEKMLISVIRGLLSNALKFANPNGSVEIQTLDDQNGFTIANSDTDIPESIVGSIHKNQPVESSFGTNGEKGIGLGISIIKTLIDLNQASIRFESTNPGTMVTVTFPKN